ncbi:acyltransferase family protein [Bradyrhizobium sp. HKCCYLR20261]|uniref:acyltransferase family protein n=1 Tax=Bradyrhizobium sp. HKCCYLR20261 TaxID=3420760 RepID=UPI003EBFACC4
MHGVTLAGGSESEQAGPVHSSHVRTEKKNEEIETLRAVAITIVAFQHSFNYLTVWQPAWAATIGSYFNLGQAGVDLFFAISGYVIARSFLPGLLAASSFEAAWREVVAFWIKRIYRLWPTVLLWVIADIVLATAFNRSGAFGPIKETIVGGVSALAQIMNFHHGYCAQGFCFSNPVYPLGPLWSLSLEEQFYACFPLLVLTLWSYKKLDRLLPLLALIAFIQLFLTRPDGSLLLYVRTDALCGGVMVYLLSSWEGLRMFREPLAAAKWTTKAVTIGVLFAILTMITGRAVSFNAGISAIASVAIVTIAHFEAGWFGPSQNERVRKVVLWIAARSYSIYVIHCIAIAFVVELWWRLTGGATPTGSATAKFYLSWIVILALAAEANWRLVEVPLRVRGRALASKWTRSE